MEGKYILEGEYIVEGKYIMPRTNCILLLIYNQGPSSRRIC